MASQLAAVACMRGSEKVVQALPEVMSTSSWKERFGELLAVSVYFQQIQFL